MMDMEQRIADLEILCYQINTNIQALRDIVSALEAGDFVESISPIVENGKEIGYVITFSKSGNITIYHGKDGKDGQDGQDGQDGLPGTNGAPGQDGIDGTDGTTPVIGIKLDIDNVYYWTLNGEWLTDGNGNKVRVTGETGKDGEDGQEGAPGEDGSDGKDGKDGVTPQLKIENGYWYVSNDGGLTWEQLGKATGEKGEKGEQGEKGDKGDQGEKGEQGVKGDSMIQKIEYDSSNIYITLPDGYTLTIPYKKTLKVSFQLGSETINTASAVIAVRQYIVSNLNITVENGSENTFISIQGEKLSCDSGADPSWDISLNDILPKTTYSFGPSATLKITSHKKASSASVVIMVSDGDLSSYSELHFRCGTDGEVIPPAETIKDLSSADGTANCYIVSSAGNYTFHATRGNETETIAGIAGVEVLWETFGTSIAPSKGDLIKSVMMNGEDIVFSTPESLQEGNAVIAAKDTYGNILWSWHIWIVEDEIKEQVYPNDAGVFMDRNLGATSCEPNTTEALGLFYQWGRKDPFAGPAAYNMNTMALTSSDWPNPVQSAPGIDIEYSIKHPTAFILCDPYSYDWYYSGSQTETDNTRWSIEKTIYDPCPAGWRVADSNDWLTAGFRSSYNTKLHGIDLTSGDEIVWLPGTGYIDPFQFKVSGTGYDGNIWTANVEPKGISAHFIGYSDYQGLTSSLSNGRRASGLSVRCQRQKDSV